MYMVRRASSGGRYVDGYVQMVAGSVFGATVL